MFQEKAAVFFPHSDWLVLVYASCQAEAQSHSHVFMENHHLHIIVVLQREEVERMSKNLDFSGDIEQSISHFKIKMRAGKMGKWGR